MSQPKFSDLKGREYFPHLDFAKLRKIRDIGIDLGNVEQFGKSWAIVLSDDLKALEVVWLTVRRDDCDQDEFLSAMDGDTLEAARLALGEAIANFTSPLKRGTIRESMAAVMKAYQQAIDEAEENIRAVLNEGIDRALQLGKLPQNVRESLATSTSTGH